MDINFKSRIDRLPELLQKLCDCKTIHRDDLSGVPVRGIYLFIENGLNIYVGRTNRMRQRLQEHGRLSGGHNDASFAFLLAKEKAKEKGIDVNRKRAELVEDYHFDSIFLEQRKRVANMHIRHIEITDPIDQCLFEVYAAEVLKTPYNDFDNH